MDRRITQEAGRARDWLQQHESDYAEEFGGPASGIKGHSIPCQYHVLHKDHRLSDFGTGDLQVVTYQLWHMKTVSYASPQDCKNISREVVLGG